MAQRNRSTDLYQSWLFGEKKTNNYKSRSRNDNQPQTARAVDSTFQTSSVTTLGGLLSGNKIQVKEPQQSQRRTFIGNRSPSPFQNFNKSTECIISMQKESNQSPLIGQTNQQNNQPMKRVAVAGARTEFKSTKLQSNEYQNRTKKTIESTRQYSENRGRNKSQLGYGMMAVSHQTDGRPRTSFAKQVKALQTQRQITQNQHFMMRVKSDIFANIEGSPSAQVQQQPRNRAMSQSVILPSKKFKYGCKSSIKNQSSIFQDNSKPSMESKGKRQDYLLKNEQSQKEQFLDSKPTKNFNHKKLDKPATFGVCSIGEQSQSIHTPKSRATSVFKHLGGNKESDQSPLRQNEDYREFQPQINKGRKLNISTAKDNQKMKKILSFGQPDTSIRSSDAFGSYRQIWEDVENQRQQSKQRLQVSHTQNTSMTNLQPLLPSTKNETTKSSVEQVNKHFQHQDQKVVSKNVNSLQFQHGETSKPNTRTNSQLTLAKFSTQSSQAVLTPVDSSDKILNFSAVGRNDKGGSISNHACLRDGMGKRKVPLTNRSTYDLIAVRSNAQKVKQLGVKSSLSDITKKWQKQPTSTTDLRQQFIDFVKESNAYGAQQNFRSGQSRSRSHQKYEQVKGVKPPANSVRQLQATNELSSTPHQFRETQLLLDRKYVEQKVRKENELVAQQKKQDKNYSAIMKKIEQNLNRKREEILNFKKTNSKRL